MTMTPRQKKALQQLDDRFARSEVQDPETRLIVLREACLRFIEESRFIRHEAGPEYDV